MEHVGCGGTLGAVWTDEDIGDYVECERCGTHGTRETFGGRTPCDHCGLAVDPDEDTPDPSLHYGCWFQLAGVEERVEAEAERPSRNPMAAEARREDDPEAYLLGVIGDPARSWMEREDAEALLTLAVDTKTIADHAVRCPECFEGEHFPMVPETGEVVCHCGQQMKPPDAVC